MLARARVFGAIFSFVCLVAIGVLAGFAWFNSESDVRLASAPAAAAPSAQPASISSVAPQTPASVLATSVSATPTTQAAARVLHDGPPLQCAIYARERTGVALTGAARTWWAQAEGRYRRTHTPEVGAVIAMLGTEAGHVAVVSGVINSREILVDHANWLGQGEIILGAQVVDVSENNDWSSVRVWHPPTNQLGLRPYPVQGFILPNPA